MHSPLILYRECCVCTVQVFSSWSSLNLTVFFWFISAGFGIDVDEGDNFVFCNSIIVPRIDSIEICVQFWLTFETIRRYFNRINWKMAYRKTMRIHVYVCMMTINSNCYRINSEQNHLNRSNPIPLASIIENLYIYVHKKIKRWNRWNNKRN